jgi:hypothetical protein
MSTTVVASINPPDTPAPEGKKWWSRPAYFFGRYGATVEESWQCAFCPREYNGLADYGREGFVCECGARFLKQTDRSFTWMWGYVPENYNQQEIWC